MNASGRVRFDQLLDGYLYLLLSGGLYGDFAPQLRPNARPITHVIDAYQAAGGSSPLTDALDALGYSQVPGAFNQLPGNVFAMGRVAVVDLRKNFNGLLPTFQNTFDEYVPPLTSSYRGQSPEVGSGKCGVGSGYASHRCEYWATPTGRWIDRSSQGGYYGYGLGNAGVALGVSRRINRNHHIGLAVGYDYANLDMHDISQKDEFHAVNAALYGGYVDRCQFLDWQVGYGKNFHNTERTVAFNGFYAKPTADYDDDVFALGLMYGRRCGAFLPSVGLELVQVWTPMFVEDGVSGAELRGERSDYTSVELPIGFRLRAAFCERGVSGSHSSPRVRSTRLVEPELRAFWVPQLGDQSSRIGTAFAGGGGEFLVDSGDFGWQHVRLGSGLTARFSRCWSGSINYDAALYSGTTRQTASVALTARF